MQDAQHTAWLSSARVTQYVGRSVMQLHAHAQASFCLVAGGEYEEHIRGRRLTHRSVHMLFCPANEMHEQRFANEGALKIVIAPTQGTLDYLSERMDLALAPFARDIEFSEVSQRLIRELRSPDVCSPLVIEGLALEAIGLFCRSRDKGERSSWIERAKAHVDAFACDDFSLATLAAVVARHPVHVARAFKLAYGMTVGERVRQVRLQKAVALLLNSRMPIGEIALDCGFCDQAHFSRSFRRVYGAAPAAFRAAAR